MKTENNEFVVEMFDGTEVRVARIDIAEILRPLLERKAASGVYVCAKPDESTKKDIFEFFESQKIPGLIAPDEYHVTIMYAPEQELADYRDDIPEDVSADTGSSSAKFDAYALYGPEKDCLVMKLDSAMLHRMHNRLAALGLKPTYPDYSPHLTLPAPSFEFTFLPDCEINAIDKDYKKNVTTVD